MQQGALMKALRLVKERKENSNIENDLRGLGSDPILDNSAPFATLSIHGLNLEDDSEIRGRYNLTAKNSQSKCFDLTCKEIREGEHKLQAMTLFVAALALFKRHSHIALHLYESSKYTEQLNSSHSRTNVNEKSGTLMLTPSIQHHLAHAGFSVQATNKNQILGHQQIGSLIRELENHKQQTHQGKRKVS